MPAPIDGSASRRSEEFTLRLLLDKLFAELAPLALERTHAMRRLVAAGAIISAYAAEGHTLKIVDEALDEIYAALPHDDRWDERTQLLERLHDQVGFLWASLLAGDREAS